MYGDLTADEPASAADVVADDAAYEDLDDYSEEFEERESDPDTLADEDGDSNEESDAEKA